MLAKWVMQGAVFEDGKLKASVEPRIENGELIFRLAIEEGLR